MLARVRVRAESAGGHLSWSSIEDDGVGFDVTDAERPADGVASACSASASASRSCKGRCMIESGPAMGTRIEVRAAGSFEAAQPLKSVKSSDVGRVAAVLASLSEVRHG